MTIAYAKIVYVFFFNDTATTEIYTLSLHDALPISISTKCGTLATMPRIAGVSGRSITWRSEEHTSELQSRLHLVCRLLLEKKKKQPYKIAHCPVHEESDICCIILSSCII